MKQRGFLYTAEAGLATLLIIIAAMSIPLFSHRGEGEAEALACSDAAGVLVKMRAFESQEKLDSSLLRLSLASGQCIEARAGMLSSGSCTGAGNRDAVSFPAWSEGRVQGATVLCSGK